MASQSDVDEKTAIRQSFSQDLSEQDKRAASGSSLIPKRYILAFMAFLGFCNVYALRVNLSVAIVAMVKNTTVDINGTKIEVTEFKWSHQFQGWILSSFFYGYIVTQLPAGWLAGRLGGKHVYGLGVLVTALLTIITPPAVSVSSHLLIAIRVIEGLFEGVTYPCLHALIAKWAPTNERSRLATIAFSGSYVGTVISMPLSGAIAQKLGWPWIFYIFGAFAVLWFIMWCYLISESPATHPSITNQELEMIQHSIGFSQSQVKGQAVPWRSILTSPAVWAIVAAHFAENWGFYTLLTELPTFLNDITHYNLYQAGFVAAVPYLVMAIMVQVGGQLADLVITKGILTTTSTRKLFNCLAFLVQAIFMLITAYMMTPVAAISCITLAVGFGGLAWAGFSVNHLDIAPQFASVLMGLSNTFATIPGIISPSLTGHIASHGTPNQWRIVFYLAGAIYCGGAIVYALFASGVTQPWAAVPSGYAAHIDEPAETEE